MEKKFMNAIDREIDILSKRYGKENDIMKMQIEYDLHSFSIFVIKQYKNAMSLCDSPEYQLPEDIKK